MIKPFMASLINAALLIILGGWAYLASANPSATALIPVGFGVLLLAFNRGLKNENKVAAHVAVLLTLLVLIGLIKPLMGAMDRSDSLALTRVLIMMFSSLYALVTFIKSFVDVRRKR
jgi:hypothetical protein